MENVNLILIFKFWELSNVIKEIFICIRFTPLHFYPIQFQYFQFSKCEFIPKILILKMIIFTPSTF
jgi:hypothetical protein